MKFSLRTAALATLTASALLCGAAQAAPISSFLQSGKANTFGDSSAETALRPVFEAGVLVGFEAPTGGLQVGDIFVSALAFDGTWSATPGGTSGNTSGNELTAFSIIQIANATSYGTNVNPCVGASADPSVKASLLSAGGCSEFTMKAASADIWNGVFSLFSLIPGDANGLARDANTVAVFYESAENFTQTGDATTVFNSALDGTQRLIAGLVAANGDGWSASGPTLVEAFGLIDFGGKTGTFDFNGTITAQGFPNWLFDANIVGDGTVRKGDPENGLPIFDQSSVTVVPRFIPEPGSLALVGVGLLGLAGVRRKHSK